MIKKADPIANFNPEIIYLVSGRLSGEDDDTAMLVEADSLGEAEEKFTQDLQRNWDDSTATVLIISSQHFSTAFTQRVR